MVAAANSMKVFLSYHPLEGELPGILLLPLPSDEDQQRGIYFSTARRLRTKHPVIELKPELVRLVKTSWKFYPPCLPMARRDCQYLEAKLKRNNLKPTLEIEPKIINLYEHSLYFHLENQRCSQAFLCKTCIDSDDLELPQGYYFWVLGYCPKNISPWEDERVLILNLDLDLDLVRVQVFGLDPNALSKRFPDTPRHFLNVRGLSIDYLPESFVGISTIQ
jgi:hypothetical protein